MIPIVPPKRLRPNSRSVSLTALVISRALKTATVASIQMPAQLLGPADRNGPHDLLMGGGQPMGLSVLLPVLAKDMGQLGACFFFSCRQLMAGQQHDRARLKRAVP